MLTLAYTLATAKGACRARVLKEEGLTTHGKSWQHAAQAIELAASQLLGWNADLNRLNSCAYECARHSADPSEDDINPQWDLEVLSQSIQYFRQQASGGTYGSSPSFNLEVSCACP
jgi:hypothetical protein